jgi:hypothetical protein
MSTGNYLTEDSIALRSFETPGAVYLSKRINILKYVNFRNNIVRINLCDFPYVHLLCWSQRTSKKREKISFNFHCMLSWKIQEII